ncbi:glycoside hydrolase family 2 TIM barrel-domain containing protein [Allomuricauda sp. NBRC 101325]|uniref:glycoside hydrolase family 2 TIM barrel-domain containing protein n=1 Tax=Allomuricauda sp. NBRC 101325 TaxID=1113758 RepID=UPI0024A3D8A6|nr:glycoside hydrolase family 2 TIM barrel-domain containing protein [Muricauda sp. NBRC 101325]GLU43652.1 hypothetical protein Musp01_12760 [Muricauda sp. NBRC 101325]
MLPIRNSYRHILWIWLIICIGYSCSSNPIKADDKGVKLLKTSDGFGLFRNGKKFHIKGAAGNTHLKELAKAGANTLRVYDTLGLKQKLDLADSLGLTIVIDLPLTISEGQIKKNTVDAVLSTVENYKNHPALLYWVLGNEVYYPKLNPKSLDEEFNQLVEKIHQIDPYHPISTTVTGGAVKNMLLIKMRCPGIDFISINSFGHLNQIDLYKKGLFFGQVPYVISEWGNNGPWESNSTTWGAPLEQTSTEKAVQIKQRYQDYIATLDDGRCLGSLAFYWGTKLETTETWFSLFDENENKTQAVFELENVWSDRDLHFKGPEIDHMLINGQRAWGSVISLPGQPMTVQVILGENNQNDNFFWEVKPEIWYETSTENVKDHTKELIEIKEQNNLLITFNAPVKEGPYRLYYTIEGGEGYVATANVPFYVLEK